MNEYTLKYTEILKDQLIQICTAKGLLGGDFFTVEELEEVWKRNAPEYLIDAIKEVNSYPQVAIAWASYFGMAAGSIWDAAWEEYQKVPQLYLYLRDKRGFDTLDEYISEEILGLEEQVAKKITGTLGDCSERAITLFRKEQVEPQSIEAYQLFLETVRIFFELGVSMELYRMGYKYEKVVLN